MVDGHGIGWKLSRHYNCWVVDGAQFAGSAIALRQRFDSAAKNCVARTALKNWTIVSENPVKYRVEVVAPKQ
jgi:hypothetical protein